MEKGSTDEAWGESHDIFGVWRKHIQTPLEGVWVAVVWRPDDEPLFGGSVGVGCHASLDVKRLVGTVMLGG